MVSSETTTTVRDNHQRIGHQTTDLPVPAQFRAADTAAPPAPTHARSAPHDSSHASHSPDSSSGDAADAHSSSRPRGVLTGSASISSGSSSSSSNSSSPSSSEGMGPAPMLLTAVPIAAVARFTTAPTTAVPIAGRMLPVMRGSKNPSRGFETPWILARLGLALIDVAIPSLSHVRDLSG